MAVTYKDYYAILGVDRGADANAVRKAYREKARKLHPDVNKEPGAEERFREVNEAYEVLGDKDKRARYDQLGANWQGGAPFEPPPGFGGYRVNVEDLGDLGDLFGRGFGQQGGRGGGGAAGGGGGGGTRFSDFFESLFGDLGGFETGAGGGPGGAGAGTGGGRARRGRRTGPERGQDIEAEIELALGDLLQPTQRRISLGVPGPDGAVQTRTVTVNVPSGLRPGSRVRLAGQGGPGAHGGPAGDIFLKIRLRPEPNVQVEGDDIVTEAELPAPIAVTGGTLRVATPEGPVTLRIAPGTQSGTVLRVKGRGLPKSGGTRGDLRVRVRVTVPEHPTERELQLYRELGELLKDGP